MFPQAEPSRQTQLRRIRPIALACLAQYGLAGARLTLVHFAFNATYRVDGTDGRRYALRVNINSLKTATELASEIAWVSALAESSAVRVPRPIFTAEGAPFAEVLGMTAVLYEWIAGPIASKRRSPDVFRSLGQATRALHEHAATWSRPASFELKIARDPLFGMPDVLRDTPHAVPFAEVLARVQAVYDRMDPRLAMPLHMDLHLNNAILSRDGLTIIDFDDMLLGWPILDVGVSLYALRQVDETGEFERAYWQGLSSSVQGMHSTQAELECLIAARGLLLANFFLTTPTASLRAIAPKYLAATAARIEHYLKTGHFDPMVASSRG